MSRLWLDLQEVMELLKDSDSRVCNKFDSYWLGQRNFVGWLWTLHLWWLKTILHSERRYRKVVMKNFEMALIGIVTNSELACMSNMLHAGFYWVWRNSITKWSITLTWFVTLDLLTPLDLLLLEVALHMHTTNGKSKIWSGVLWRTLHDLWLFCFELTNSRSLKSMSL